jgi:DNA mismatch repair protein MutS
MASTDERSIRWKLMSHSGHLQVVRDEEALAPGATRPRFLSILFPDGTPELGAVAEPLFFRDLNLDQVVEAAAQGREEYDLVPFYWTPLASVESVEYRHEIFRDLDGPAVRDAVREFGERMHRVRAFLMLARKQHYKPERQRWLADAVALYVEAVRELSQAFSTAELGSSGLREFAAYLADHLTGAPFDSLASEVESVLAGLAGVTYDLRIKGAHVSVGRYEVEPDYGDEIEELFARFRQGGVESKLMNLGDGGSMDHVEARIAQLVGRIFPREFKALDRFCSRYADFIDPTIASFDREIQFYLAWLDFQERVSGADLSFCYPKVSSDSKHEVVEDAFDVALAAKLRGGGEVVRNGYRLQGDERFLVVSGPNQGGKTTFARMFAQLHYLAALGIPVAARTARLFLVHQTFTHFEREEVVGSLRGKLDEELVRVQKVLEAATPRSLVVLNEMFSSATLADARDLGAAVLDELIESGGLGVCVTFIDELSRRGVATVSMVAQVSQDDPARRTFQVLRQPADGRAYAWALAQKYGLSYEQLRERLS